MASTFTNLLYHVVYSTKHRRPLIAPNWRDDLYAYIGGIVKERDGVPLRTSATNRVTVASRLPGYSAQ